MSLVLEQITPQVSSLKPQTFIVSHSLLGSGIWELLSWVDLAWGLARGCSQAVGQVFGLPKALLGWEVGVPRSHEWLWAESSSSSPRGPLPRAARASAADLFESEPSKRARSRWEMGCLYHLGKDIPLLLRVLRVTQKGVDVRRWECWVGLLFHFPVSFPAPLYVLYCMFYAVHSAVCIFNFCSVFECYQFLYIELDH